MKPPAGSVWSLPRLLSGLLVLLGLLFGGLWLAGMLQVRREPAVTPPFTRAEAVLQPTVEMARSRLLQYFSALDDPAKCTFLHDPERVSALWRDFYRERKHPLPMLDEILGAALVESDGRTLALFEVRLSPGGRQPLAMIWDGKAFGLDWESFSAYGSMDWIEWVETRPRSPQTMRVYLSRIPEGLSGAGPREEEWVCVEHRDSLQPVMAKIEPGSGFKLDFTGRQRVPVTAEFEFRTKGEGRQLHLTKMAHEGWSR